MLVDTHNTDGLKLQRLYLVYLLCTVFAQGALQSPPGSILPVNQTVLNGTSVTFECKFPNVTYVLWAFNGRVLQHGDMYGSDLLTPFKLIFAEVNYRLNVGPYQCFHYNNSVKIYESPMVYLDIQCECFVGNVNQTFCIPSSCLH